MYKKVSSSLNFVEREREILDFWKDKKIFERSIERREGNRTFTFYDGPPTANGMPHIGHILTRVIKDIIPRYKTMKGYKVLRKAGWDTHGLPVELEVEKLLGINGKPEIEAYGVEPFIQKCKESVWKYEGEWRRMSDRVGFWADMDDPYVTYHNNYMESVWWALKQIWDRNLIYKGHKVVPYCARCGTSLSSHEVAQGYQDVKETSIYVKFKVKDKENLCLLAWTTTPWTLISNLALTVNPREEYVKAALDSDTYILARALVEKVLGPEAKILESFKGEDLYGMEYEPLFDFAEDLIDKKAFFVIHDDFVTLTDGTGIVHTAPAFGEDDSRVGKKFGLPFLQLVNDEGKFTGEVHLWADMFVKDGDPHIIDYLEKTGALFKREDYEHSYPFCWRCDTALLYYARSTWYIATTKVKENLMENNQKINWYPENIKNGRFGKFLENNVDWALSRERYWGTPLPIWECSCGHRHMVGSIAELKEKGLDVPEDIELHKPYIDNVYLKCDKCGRKDMKRVPEVIDCWFDSGAMPFAQWHYPFENEELFKENFPADFISEAIDQTRGWFYTLHAISTLIFKEPSFMNCIVMGHVQDKDGQKMSKHKGNVVDPWTILDKQGADAVRWYFYTASSPWLPSRFYEEAVNEVQRKFMGTLWNTYAFYILYANIDKFDPSDHELEYEKLSVMDKWLLSKLNTLIKTVDMSLEGYQITEGARAIQNFTDELSNWYVRRSRERFWEKGMEKDKINGYLVLYTALSTLIRLSAPFVPFLAEEIYQNLVRSVYPEGPESVHFCDFPSCDEGLVKADIEREMDTVLKVVVAGRAARNEAAIKTRQPIGLMYTNEKNRLSPLYEDIVKEELNIKKIEYLKDTEGFVDFLVKPQLKTVGPKYGPLVGRIREHLVRADGEMIKNIVSDGKPYTFEVNGTPVTLFEEDLLIETVKKEGFVSQTYGDATVILNTVLDDGLIEEGFVREMISKIQTMRKEAGFEVTDRIIFYIKDNGKLSDIVDRNSLLIKEEVLADEITHGDAPPEAFAKQWDINGETALFAVKRR